MKKSKEQDVSQNVKDESTQAKEFSRREFISAGSAAIGLFLAPTNSVAYQSFTTTFWKNRSNSTPGTLWSWGDNASGQIGDSTIINRLAPVIVGSASDWKNLAAGNASVFAIKSSGSLWGWGANNNWQLADGSMLAKSAPIQIGTDTDWKAVSFSNSMAFAIKNNNTLWAWGGSFDQSGIGYWPVAHRNTDQWLKASIGEAHILVVKNDNTLWGWGSGSNYRLGDNSVATRSSPVQVGGGTSDWKDAAASLSSSMAVKTNGTLWGWGATTSGTIGLNWVGTSTVSLPVQVNADTDWSSVLMSDNYFSLGLKNNGSLWTWGQDIGGMTLGQAYWKPYKLFSDNGWKDATAGDLHSLAIKSDGTLWATGDSTNYVLGNGAGGPISWWTQVGADTNWNKISSSNHTLAIKQNGTLWGWGSNLHGQVGNGTTVNPSVPVQIGSSTLWDKIQASTSFSMALQTNGTLWSWGFNTGGMLGIGNIVNQSTPQQIGSDTNWTSFSAGSSHAVAIKNDGSLWVWGRNSNYQLGFDYLYPRQSGSDAIWSRVASGASYSMAIRTDGTLWGWGDNSSGEIGLGNTFYQSQPVQVGVVNTWKDLFISPAYYPMSAAIRTDDTLWTWGRNIFGQLGIGNVTNMSTPTQVSGSWKVVSTWEHVLAIKTDKTLWSWGSNTRGQLGTNAGTTNASVPVQIGTEATWWQVAAGASHSMALKEDGTLWSWGYNYYGALGGGSTRSSPVQVGSDTWKHISAEGTNSYGIKTDGTLWGWGQNNSGQLGVGDTFQKNSPVQVGSANNWDKTYCNFAIRTDGTLWAWGNNVYGNLGLGHTTTPVLTPQQVGSVSNWSQISRGTNASFGIRSDFTMWAWGANSPATGLTYWKPFKLEGSSNWTNVACGTLHSLALKDDNSLWVWGYNNFGSLGLGDNLDRSSPVQLGNLTDWAAVFAARYVSYALKTDGTLWSWGQNIQAMLGDDTTITRSSPVQIGTLNNWAKITGSHQGSHAMALSSDGSFYGWGMNQSRQMGLAAWSPRQIDEYQYLSAGLGRSFGMAVRSDGTLWGWGKETALGLNSSRPIQIGIDTNWTSVVAGSSHAIMLKSNGTIHGIGLGSQGQLGRGNTFSSSSAVQIGSASNWTQIAAASFGTFAWDDNSDVWAWGSNNRGQLGIGAYIDVVSSPMQMANSNGWKRLASGPSFALGIKNDDRMWVWGAGSPSSFGFRFEAPTRVGPSSDWKTVSAGLQHTFALKNDGTLWAWGYAYYGRLGNGMTSAGNVNIPVQVGGDTNWQEVLAGYDYGMGLKTTGTLWSWGRNNYAQLGDGTSIDKSLPVQIGADTDWSKIFPGTMHSAAIKNDGTLWLWGNNNYGQLGDGTSTFKLAPQKVNNDTDWISVSLGSSHTVAAKSDGSVWAWGINNKGQLGDGTSVNRSLPVKSNITISATGMVMCGSSSTHAIK